MARRYYAVCNVNGPISVRLEGETEEQVINAFTAADSQAWMDSARTDAEDDLDIDGSEMDETEFAAALEGAGCVPVRDLSPVVNAHAGTVSHLAGGWWLWEGTAAFPAKTKPQ